MRKRYILNFMALSALLLSGCSMRQIAPAGVAGLVGAGAYELSDGDGAITAGAVVGSFVATEYILTQMEKDDRSQFAAGYEQARSDAVKELYWSKVELDSVAELVAANETESSPYPEPKKKYIVKPMPTVTADGRVLEDHYVQIPILE